MFLFTWLLACFAPFSTPSVPGTPDQATVQLDTGPVLADTGTQPEEDAPE